MSVPAALPVSIPAVVTEALLLLTLHTPPATPLVSDTADDTHTLVGPVIAPADGAAITFTFCVVTTVAQLLLIE